MNASASRGGRDEEAVAEPKEVQISEMTLRTVKGKIDIVKKEISVSNISMGQ